jgi:hypothetical protein
MGHAVYFEEASEIYNCVLDNLIVNTKQSFSLMNTDMTPASMWISHPTNTFRNNHVAGSKYYGFWLDYQTHPLGSSEDENVCPEKAPLGQFKDNVAHSNGVFGVYLFHSHWPRTYPCQSMTYDATDPNNPYPNNPAVLAQYENLTAFKNGESGMFAHEIGAVQIVNAKVTDHPQAGVEVHDTWWAGTGYQKVIGGLYIGKSSNDGGEVGNNVHGVIAPSSPGFEITGSRFFNYNEGNNAALGDCSYCSSWSSTDSGARQVDTSALYFDADSVTKRIYYQWPRTTIWKDDDGTLTGLGSQTGQFVIGSISKTWTSALMTVLCMMA